MTNSSRQHTRDRTRVHRTVYGVMFEPDEVILTTLPDGHRWASDGYTAVDLTALELAEAFADIPDRDGYQLRRNRPPVQRFPGKPGRDPAEIAAALTNHVTRGEGASVSVSRYTLASGNGRKPRYVRFLTTHTTIDQGEVLVTVNGPAYDAWDRLLTQRQPTPDSPFGVELLPGTEEPERLELGMLRWKAAGRVVGLLMAVRPSPFPQLPGALLAAAGTRNVTAATDALTDAAAHLHTAVTALRTAELPQLADDISHLATRTETATDRLTA